MENSKANLYNRPLRSAMLISALSVILILTMLGFYVLKPFVLSQNAMYRGMALFADVMNILLGYLVIIVLFALGLANTYLSYGARRSDNPPMAKLTGILAWVTVAAAFLFAVWFTLRVLKLYNAFGIFS